MGNNWTRTSVGGSLPESLTTSQRSRQHPLLSAVIEALSLGPSDPYDLHLLFSAALDKQTDLCLPKTTRKPIYLFLKSYATTENLHV